MSVIRGVQIRLDEYCNTCPGNLISPRYPAFFRNFNGSVTQESRFFFYFLGVFQVFRANFKFFPVFFQNCIVFFNFFPNFLNGVVLGFVTIDFSDFWRYIQIFSFPGRPDVRFYIVYVPIPNHSFLQSTLFCIFMVVYCRPTPKTHPRNQYTSSANSSMSNICSAIYDIHMESNKFKDMNVIKVQEAFFCLKNLLSVKGSFLDFSHFKSWNLLSYVSFHLISQHSSDNMYT